MKKLLFSLVALLLCATMAHAKHSLVATLNHNDTVSVYYGLDALNNAYNAARTGDVITLSSGAFLAVNITKAITIRGAGMEKDSINGIEPTVLLGDFEMSGSNITMEGIYHKETVTFGRNTKNGFSFLFSSNFSKCRFNNLETGIYGDTYSHIEGLKFTHCRILAFKGYDNRTSNINKFNSCIVMYLNTVHSSMQYEMTNCIVATPISTNNGYIQNSLFYNCIINSSNQLHESNVAYHCVGRYTGSNTGSLFANTPGEGLFNTDVAADNLIFKTFRGTYTDEETFELTDEAAAKYLGGDGTQVGIYGGVQPYNPETTLPKITKFTVAPKTTEEGMLNVDIEVSAAE